MTSEAPLVGRTLLHVCVTAAFGAVAVSLAELGTVSLAFGNVVGAIFMAGFAFALFAVIGRIFLGPAGWTQGLTVFVWMPLVVWAYVGSSGDNGLEGTNLLTYAVGAAAAGVAALLTHQGWPRRAGVAIAILTVVTTTVTSIHHHHVDDRRAAIVAFGSTMRPWVIGLDGYRQKGDPIVIGPKTLRTSFYRPGPTLEQNLELTITTDASTTVVCGDVIRTTLDPDFDQPEKTCRQSAGIWRRTSKQAHEVALVKGHRVVRVAGSSAVPEESLIKALRSVRPMSDRYYRHALFGEEGQYIPELDGRRP